jgi:DNA transposition AAA+ family ATPase
MKKEEQEQLFPRDLLKEDAATKRTFFKEFRVLHPIMDDVLRRLRNAIEDADRDSMIYLYGSTGVGKTTVQGQIEKELTEQLLPELETDRSRMSVVRARLKAPSPPAYFSWTDNFARLLDAADEPLVGRKIHPDEIKLDDGKRRITSRQTSSPKALQFAYEKLLEHRRPIAVLLDEAQVMVSSSATRLTHQLDVIKSVAADTGVPHVLFGTYALLEVRNLDGQVARRSTDIHFRRYSNTSGDYQNFVNVVGTLALAMPFDKAPDLMSFVGLLHEKSAGCIGLLQPWLYRAYCEALRKNAESVTLEALQASALGEAALAVIFDEISNGENAMQEGLDKYATSLNGLVGGGVKGKPTEDISDDAKGPKRPQARVTSKPGVRKANRDLIGSRTGAAYRGKTAKTA